MPSEFNNEVAEETEQKLFDAVMDATRYIRENICKTDEEWQQIQRLMRVDGALQSFYICQENNINFDIDEYTHDFDFDLIYKKD